MLSLIEIMKSSIFRLYDVRGKYPTQLNEGVVFSIAYSLKSVFRERGFVVVGYDARASSQSLYAALCEGLSRAGVAYREIGFCSTPMITHFIHSFSALGGVMVTASHNPAIFNGLKFFDRHGMGIGGNVIKHFVRNQKAPFIPSFVSKKACTRDVSPYHKKYVRFLKRSIFVSRPLTVVVDASNGSTGPIWSTLEPFLRARGISLILINNIPDGVFSAHGPNPLLRHAQQNVRQAIIRHKADLGIILDGDGDRAVFFDEYGKVTFSSHIWRLLLVLFQKRGVTKSVVSVVDEFEAKIFNADLFDPASFSVSPVGHIFLRSEMKKTRSIVGIEGSGHYYFSDFYYSDSGVFASLCVIRALSGLPYSFSNFISLLPSVVRLPEKNIACSYARYIQLRPKILSLARSHGYTLGRMDGYSMFGETVGAVIRYSNTESVARVVVSGIRKGDCVLLLSEISRLFH